MKEVIEPTGVGLAIAGIYGRGPRLRNLSLPKKYCSLFLYIKMVLDKQHLCLDLLPAVSTLPVAV